MASKYQMINDLAEALKVTKELDAEKVFNELVHISNMEELQQLVDRINTTK